MTNTICERIAKARKLAKFSQREIAGRLGISFQTQNMYERGHRLPDAEYLQRLTNIAKVNPGWLLTGLDSEEIEVYNDDERSYCKRLLRLMRTKPDKVVHVAKQSIDLWLDTPDKEIHRVLKKGA